MYALMGGHVEDAENPIDAVIREAKEELGLTIKREDIKSLLTMAVCPDHIYLYFGCDKFEGEVSNCEIDQCDDISFFDKNSLPDNIIGADNIALETIITKPQLRYISFGY
jgi:8-oxo-dGTP pyrophosphatase MutT (NUDIX family)